MTAPPVGQRGRPALPLVQASPPPFPLIAAHFAAGFCWLLLGTAGLIWQAPTLAGGAFLDPRLAAVTHLLTLGWITTVITGVLHQIIPVLLGVNARSARVAGGSLLAHTLGTALLAVGLMTGRLPLTVAGWSVLFLAVFGTAWNLLPARRRAVRNRRLGVVVSYAHMGFGLAMGVAGVRIGDLLGWWATPRLGLISAHFHLAAAGFATMTAFGVGAHMIPMFLGAQPATDQQIRWLPRLLASGAVCFSAGAILSSSAAAWTGAALMAGAVLLFLHHAFRWVHGRERRMPDPAIALILAALVWLGLALLLGVDALGRGATRPGVVTSYAATVILGWLTALILAVSYRVLPNLAWHHRFGGRPGRPDVPPPSAMLQPALGWLSLGCHSAGMLALVGGLHRSSGELARLGAVLLFLAGLATALHHLRLGLVGRGT